MVYDEVGVDKRRNTIARNEMMWPCYDLLYKVANPLRTRRINRLPSMSNRMKKEKKIKKRDKL